MNIENNAETAALLTIEKIREVTGCPAGIDVQDWVKQLAAENAVLKTVVSEIHNELYGQGFQVSGWHLNGDLEPLDSWFEENNWNPETPATDAFLAEVRASAIDSLVDIKTKQLADMHPDTHAFVATAMSIRSQINEMQVFASLLRKGVQS